MTKIECVLCGYKSNKEEEFQPLDDDKIYCHHCARDIKHQYLNKGTVYTGEF